MGLIIEPNIIYPVLVYLYLVIKPVAHFYSSSLILFSQFLLNLNVIREKISRPVSIYGLCLSNVVDKTFSDFEQQTGGQSQWFLKFWLLWFVEISLVNIVNGSISLKLL